MPARALAALYNNFTQIVVRDNPAIVRVADLKGQDRVGRGGRLGDRGHREPSAYLRRASISARDIVRQSLGVSQSVDQLKDGKIDAFFWSGGVPTAPRCSTWPARLGLSCNLIPSDDSAPALPSPHGAGLYAALVIPQDGVPGHDL